MIISATSPGTTITGRFRPAKQSVYDTGGASHPGLYGNGIFRAVQGTGSAFHALIPPDDPGFPVFHCKYFVWTNNDAHPATVAFLTVEGQGHHIAEINESVHNVMNFERSQPAAPRAAMPICKGSAVFISF